MPAEPSELYDLSPRTAGSLLGVHEDTVKRWADAGQLPCMRTPGGYRRFRRSDIDAFLVKHRQAAS